MAKQLSNRRVELQEKLEALLGSRNVYFQPPENIKMVYPAIVYEVNRLEQRHADDIPYRKLISYSVKVIDRNPNLDWIDKLLDSFSYCYFERTYVSDSLNHYSFVLYY